MARALFDFSGTTTVVTGGASGIGKALAELISGKRPAMAFGFCGEDKGAPRTPQTTAVMA